MAKSGGMRGGEGLPQPVQQGLLQEPGYGEMRSLPAPQEGGRENYQPVHTCPHPLISYHVCPRGEEENTADGGQASRHKQSLGWAREGQRGNH